MSSFQGLADQLEGAIDGQFGCNATWTPMLGSKGYTAPIPDPFEPQKTIVGYIVTRRAVVRPGGNDTMFQSKRADADVLFSIQLKYLGDMKAGDRLDIEDRPDEQYEISFIEPPTYTRTVLHLVRVRT